MGDILLNAYFWREGKTALLQAGWEDFPAYQPVKVKIEIVGEDDE